MRKFYYALRGLLLGFGDSSIRLQWCLGLLAILFFWRLRISVTEWCLVLLCCGMVVVSEYFNTVIEQIMDFQCQRQDVRVEKIKDLSAGAVLAASIVALAVGLLIVWNHFTL